MKNQLTTCASLPGSGSGCQSALPAEKAKAAEPKITDYDEAVKIAAKLVGEAITEAIEAYRTAMREMVRAVAQEVVKQAIAELAEDAGCDDAEDWCKPQNFGGYPAIPADETPSIRLTEVYPVGEPTPWQNTHESVEYMGGDGRMYQYMGLPKIVEWPRYAEWRAKRDAEKKTDADLLDAAGGGE